MVKLCKSVIMYSSNIVIAAVWWAGIHILWCQAPPWIPEYYLQDKGFEDVNRPGFLQEFVVVMGDINRKNI